MSDTPSGFGDLPPELDPRGPRKPGTPARGRIGRTPWATPLARRRTPAQKVAGWVAAAASVAVLLAAGGFWVVYHNIFGNIAHIDAFDALAKNGIHRPARGQQGAELPADRLGHPGGCRRGLQRRQGHRRLHLR